MLTVWAARYHFNEPKFTCPGTTCKLPRNLKFGTPAVRRCVNKGSTLRPPSALGENDAVGFDDVRFATLLSVPLTTIQQPCRDIALTAFNAMRERIADPTLPSRSLLLAPKLIVRESCGAYLPR